MSKSATFGMVGGYGATGRVVVSELLKSCDGKLRIGGRDPARIKSLANIAQRACHLQEDGKPVMTH